MKQGDCIFVYGTLRPSERADLTLSRRAMHLGPDRINGLLYHLGWYPGAVFEPSVFDENEPSIIGDVFLVRDSELVGQLDAYEGYPSLYGRCETYTENARRVWVYFYRGDVSKLEPLRTGDWSAQKMSLVQGVTS